MKIIDVLNKVANGEEVPEKIFYAEQYWINRYPNDYEGLGYGGCLLNNVCLNNLNDEVEIIEEKKIPEKIEDRARFQYSEIPTWLEKKEIIKAINENFEKHQKAIYEIIDYLKSKGE